MLLSVPGSTRVRDGQQLARPVVAWVSEMGLWAVANPAQYVRLAVPDGASDTKLGGVKSRGR